MQATHQNYPVTRDGWKSIITPDGNYFLHTHEAGEIYASTERAKNIEAVAFRGGETLDLGWFDTLDEAKVAVLSA